MALSERREDFDQQFAHRPLQSLRRGFDGLSGDGDWLFLAFVTTEPPSGSARRSALAFSPASSGFARNPRPGYELHRDHLCPLGRSPSRAFTSFRMLGTPVGLAV